MPKVKEYVYNLQNNPQFITNVDEKLIVRAVKGISNGQYTDLTNKCGKLALRISQNPPDEPPNNQENINCNRNMNKKLIRLTESDLHRIVRESVNKVITELDWKTYANAADEAYGRWINAPKYSKERGKESDRAKRLARYSDEVFNKEYGGKRIYKTKDGIALYSATKEIQALIAVVLKNWNILGVGC